MAFWATEWTLYCIDGPANLHMETYLFIKAGKKRGKLNSNMLSGAVITIKHLLTSVYRRLQSNSQNGGADVLNMMQQLMCGWITRNRSKHDGAKTCATSPGCLSPLGKTFSSREQSQHGCGTFQQENK